MMKGWHGRDRAEAKTEKPRGRRRRQGLSPVHSTAGGKIQLLPLPCCAAAPQGSTAPIQPHQELDPCPQSLSVSRPHFPISSFHSFHLLASSNLPTSLVHHLVQLEAQPASQPAGGCKQAGIPLRRRFARGVDCGVPGQSALMVTSGSAFPIISSAVKDPRCESGV